MNTQEPFVILSAEQSGATPRTNSRNTAALRERLANHFAGWRSKPLIGSYAGTLENSFLIIIAGINQDLNLTEVLGWAREYNQESVLFVDANRQTSLLFPLPHGEHQTVELGAWRAVCEADAIASDGFTYDPQSDQYFLAAGS